MITSADSKSISNNLQGIVDWLLAQNYKSDARPLKEDEAFVELERLADLQLTSLHSGQAIQRQIDSTIKLWRKRKEFGGGSSVMAEHYIDALQTLRIAIFGVPLASPANDKEILEPDRTAEFQQFIVDNAIKDDKLLPMIQRAFEAAWHPDRVQYLDDDVISVNGTHYRKLSDDEKRAYSFA